MTVGFEFTDAGGNVMLDSNSLGMRLVHLSSVGADFSGDVSIPEYDSTRGVHLVRPILRVYNNFTGSPYGEADDVTLQPHNSVGVVGANSPPSLAWNGTSKLMTVTPATVPNPIDTHEDRRAGFHLICLHYI